ncbi:hypothetical protein A1O3_07797 [Capronia epimyces CBS 606.96]|uniref:Cytochrome P450 n=1 Tax=Capronia epimyces CBS 606.96 TaxID=1182542 RepID=W9XH22_9EURO|nr:uncharacterized protein A1O3_07797 [Capronia epimyces CBS 606.96]EXJ79518.1 hypothetical protein A1O3_07797 [Capronia epimyces CBS 606.96]
MSPDSFTSTWYSILLVLALIPTAIFFVDILRWMRMPPGPRPLPFIGNKLSIPRKHPWIQFQEWSKIYGPIFTIWIGRRPTCIISDADVAAELMEKRSSKYSSRPRFVTMGELYWDMATMLVQPYGKAWSIRRKLLHTALTPTALSLYQPVQEAEAVRLCNQLLEAPASWERHIERFTSSIVFTVSYGHRIDSLEDKTMKKRQEFMVYVASLNVPGAFLVESLPFLKYLPNAIAPWKAEVQRRGHEEAAFNMALVEDVQQDLDTAKDPSDVADSLCKILLLARKANPESFSILSDRDFSFLPAAIFGAGSDTTASTLCSAILALVTHPHVLQTAHDELDRVVGPNRLPTFADEPSLPYIRALCKEVLRWRPVSVLGGQPHATSEPDEYAGYHIPANTTVLGNSWAINMNERYYPNPHRMNPLRFLSPAEVLVYARPDESDDKGEPHPNSKMGHSTFGWGRRVCPGADLAVNSLFAAMSKLLWAYDIKPLKGVTYDIFDYTEGFNIRPNPFQCEIRVRSKAHREVLQENLKGAEKTMERFPVFDKSAEWVGI